MPPLRAGARSRPGLPFYALLPAAPCDHASEVAGAQENAIQRGGGRMLVRMADPLLLILLWLTAYRATRLLARDTFPPIAIMRARIEERWGGDSWQAYLTQCSWCLGVWMSAAVVAAVDYTLGLPAPWLVWGATCSVVGLIATVEPE